MAGRHLRQDEMSVILQNVDGDLYIAPDSKEDVQNAYFVAISDEQDFEDGRQDLEPAAKCIRLDDDANTSADILPSLHQILSEMNKEMCVRLDSIERKLETLDQRTKQLESRLEQVSSSSNLQQQNTSSYTSVKTTNGTIVVGLQGEKLNEADQLTKTNENTSSFESSDLQTLGPNITLITLNSEADYPNGSWLGNENIPDQRVRVPISRTDLLHVESNCRTPEKMALALLDYLFDRDTQACSNLSGTGRHGKKKLDPLFIYGIRCHLVHWFGISEKEWHKIKLNIDSKCRTAFRRKMHGMSLAVKAFRGRSQPTVVSLSQKSNPESEDDSSVSVDNATLQIDESTSAIVHQPLQLISDGGQLRFISATSEQVARLKPCFQILSDGQFLLQTDAVDAGGTDATCGIIQNVALSTTDDGISIITSDHGDLLQIVQEANSVSTTASNVTSSADKKNCLQ